MNHLCRRCNGVCEPNKALQNQLVSYDDFGFDHGDSGTTQSRTGKAVIIDCFKCKNCGHSFVPEEIVDNNLNVSKKIKQFKTN